MTLPLIDVATVQWTYLGLLIAFTICLALVTQLTKGSGLRWWLASNLVTACAFPLFILRPSIVHEDIAFLLPTTMAIIAAALKLIALTPGSQRRGRFPAIAVLLLLFVALYETLEARGLLAERLALSLGTLSILTFSIAWSAFTNIHLKGIPGKGLLVAAFALSALILAALSMMAINRVGDFAYFSQGPTQSFAFGANLLQLILVHIGFIAVVIGRLTKVQSLRANRRLEQSRRRRLAEQHSARMQELADERQSLLDLLTHEVRQPLNNAQAAIQEISRSIGKRKLAELGMSLPVSRLYSIIDEVVLALSNGIVAAGLIDRRSTARPDEPVDVCHIAELAAGDCPLSEQDRILLDFEHSPIFAQGDPVLLRLAFRNLLDNALKYSLEHSLVSAQVIVDGERLGTVFRVSNVPAAPFEPDKSLFSRGVRGNEAGSGKGLGLFIVSEVSAIHGGSANASCSDELKTVFEMFIPG